MNVIYSKFKSSAETASVFLSTQCRNSLSCCGIYTENISDNQFPDIGN